MNPLRFTRAQDTAAAISGIGPDSAFIAGGTDLIQLLRDGIATPSRLIDISSLPMAEVVETDKAIEIGAGMRLRDVADHPAIAAELPLIADALRETASPQVRNMATVGGNLLQRTRCLYFRDTAAPCNKRAPGSGCGAMDGCNRINAILGGSDQCIATHPSDLAVALTALDAEVVVQGDRGERAIAMADFYVLPGDTPQIETTLEPGELIVAVRVPRPTASSRSAFVKLRDRATFEWALVSCAVALDFDRDTVSRARIVAGAVAPRPWRLENLETMVTGQRLDRSVIAGAAECAASGADTRPGNAFKVDLLREAVARALGQGAAA